MVKTSEYNYIIKTIILSLLIRKPRLFSIHFCTKKLLEYFLTIDTYYDSEERDKKFLISSRMGHAFGRISVDLYREAADTLWSRSINGARCFDPVITVSQERALFRRQRTTRIESRRYLHPCTRGRRFNASFEFLAELTTSRALLSDETSPLVCKHDSPCSRSLGSLLVRACSARGRFRRNDTLAEWGKEIRARFSSF